MAFSFTLTDTIPAAPDLIYDAWLDSRGHTAMTGSAAEAAATEGAVFTAWGGYISGRNLSLERALRIVQAWRTTRFTADDPDSQIEVLLEPVPEGTRLTLHHTNIPDGHTGYQNGGWQEHYFDPYSTDNVRTQGSPSHVRFRQVVLTLRPTVSAA